MKIIDKKLQKTIDRITVVIIMAVLLTAFLGSHTLKTIATGSATITVSPNTSAVTIGNNVSVTVSINSGATEVNSAQVNLTYDASKLSFVSIATQAEPYETQLSYVNGSGSLAVARGSLNGSVTGSQTFMTITFKSSATGNALVSVASGTDVLNATDYTSLTLGTLGSTTIKVNPVPASPPSTPNPPANTNTNTTPTTPANTDTTPASPAPTNTNSNTAPSSSSTPPPTQLPDNPPATEVVETPPAVVERDFKKAVIKLKTNVPVKAQIVYGVDGQFNLATAVTDFTTEPVLSLDPSLLNAGRTYSYKAVLTDQQGNVTETDVMTFKAKGYPVKLVILDKKRNPVKRVKVILHSETQESETNDNGEVTFEDVETGEHTATFEIAGTEFSQVLSVADNLVVAEDGTQTAAVQVTEISVNTTSSKLMYLIIGGVIGVLTALVVTIIVLKKRYPGNHISPGGASLGGVDPDTVGFNDINSTKSSINDDYLKPSPPDADAVIHPEAGSSINGENKEN